ncbi:unnamed protein product, partial [Rotaria sp. Silwood1]
MHDSHRETILHLQTRNIADAQLASFIEQENRKQHFRSVVHILTERCWDLCSPNISSRLDDRSEKCLADCVERFLDSSNYIMNKISQEGVAARTRINGNEFSSLTDFSLGAPDIAGEPCDVVQFTEYVRKNIQLYKMINGIELSPYACANFTQNEMATSLRSLNSFLANLIVGGYSTNQCNQQHAQLYSIDYLDAMISANKLLQIIVNELGKHIATYLHCIFVRIIGEQGMHVLDNMYPENIIIMSSIDSQLYEWWLYEEAVLERDKHNVDVFCHHRRVQLMLLDTWRHVTQIPIQVINQLADRSIESYWATRPCNKNAIKQTDKNHHISFSHCLNWPQINGANIRQKMMSDKIRPLFKGYGDGRNPLCGQINLLSIKTPKTSSFIDNQPQTLNKKRPAPACFSDDKIDTSISHHYRPPFGKQQQPQTQQEPLSFRTARDQLEIDEARTKTNGIIVKKSLGMHSVAKRSIYNRYVDPTGGRQTQGDSNQQMIPPPPTPSAPVLQINQSNNTEPSNNKLEESGRAKHIDPKLIAMITRDANRPLFSGL